MKTLRGFRILLAMLCVVARADAEMIHFHTEKAGFVSLDLDGPDGKLIRRVLAGKPFAAGDHTVTDNGPEPPGAKWRAVFREALGLGLMGRIGDFGGDRGPATAVAADDARVYLGWALATANADAIVACDPSGAVQWTHRRGALSGCRALAVDGGILYVLGGEGAADAEGRAIYKLDAKTGTAIRWPDGRSDLRIVSLWPAKGHYRPALTNNMAVKNGRIYLSFSQGQFVAILDAQTGAYLQTIVGAAPGAIDAVATRADEPDDPGQLVDADFVVMAIKSGAIGKMLLAHDPIWVLGSELTPMDDGRTITALRMIGDGAKVHARDIFVALGRPFDQVEARSALQTDTVSYVAGTPGAPLTHGVWQPGRMGDIRGIALDTAGQLWVAEGDAIPSRISVWSTDGDTGRLVHEYFAPPDAESPLALDPLDPTVAVAGGCEWRIDPVTGRGACAGVITGEIFKAARFAKVGAHLLLVLTPASGAEVVMERVAAGDYRAFAGPAPVAAQRAAQMMPAAGGGWDIVTADGFDLGKIADPGGDLGAAPMLTEMQDGRLFVIVRRTRVEVLQITGMRSVQPLAVIAE